MLDGDFDGAWLKWGWAVAHGQRLGRDIKAVGASPKGEQLKILSRCEYDPRRRCISMRVAYVQPVPPHWSLILGDVAHNYRSCLDHIAWALASRGTTPPETLRPRDQKRIGFPIFTSPSDFRDALGRMLPGVHRRDVAIVRRYQPFRSGKRAGDSHPLAILRELSNEDKHRQIRPVLSLPVQLEGRVTGIEDCVVTRMPAQLPRVPLAVGTEIGRFYVRKTGPNPRLSFEHAVRANASLNEEKYIHEWIDEILVTTSQLLSGFADSPPGFSFTSLGVELPESES